MDCERIKELLLSYIDNEIDDDERKLVEVHLSGCADCSAEMEALAVTGSRLRQAYETVAAGVSPSAAVWQAIKNKVEAKRRTSERDANRAGSRWGWLFGWRRPVWRTAVAGAAMLSFMIVFAINSAPVSMWTVAEQQAIDIAINDSDVQELLADKGVVYEVVPMNGEDSNLYQVAFFNYDSADTSKELGANAWRGSQQTDGPSSVVSESDSNEAEICVVSGGTVYNVKGADSVDAVDGALDADSVEIPVSVESYGSVIVDLDTETVDAFTATASLRALCLDTGTLDAAATIAIDDPRIDINATVENVALLDEYDLDEGEFTDDIVLWVRLNLSGASFFAQVDLEDQNVVKIVDGGE